MRIFKLFNDHEEIKTRANRNNVYFSLVEAKNGLKLYLRYTNKKVVDKNLQLKADQCEIVEYELVHRCTYRL